MLYQYDKIFLATFPKLIVWWLTVLSFSWKMSIFCENWLNREYCENSLWSNAHFHILPLFQIGTKMLIFFPCGWLMLKFQWWVFPPRTSWWRHQMETFSALLAICAGNSLVPCEFPTQRPVKQSFEVFFDLRLNKRLSKQSWGLWFEMLSCPLWRHCNVA